MCKQNPQKTEQGKSHELQKYSLLLILIWICKQNVLGNIIYAECLLFQKIYSVSSCGTHII